MVKFQLHHPSRINTRSRRCVFYSSALIVLILLLCRSISELDNFIINNNTAIPTSEKGCIQTSSSSSTTATNSEDNTFQDPTWVYDNNGTPLCQFQLSDDAPIPVLFISLGRAGSSITWDTVARLSGVPPVRTAYEITGGNTTKSMLFFDSIDQTIGDKWALLKLCQIQNRKSSRVNDGLVYGKGGISGFQWKPYRVTWDHEYAINGLKRIADHRHPPIKVIYLNRNPLSRIISNIRHEGHIRSDELPAHCDIDDTACIQKHQSLSQGITLPTGKELRDSIFNQLILDGNIVDRLTTFGVPHISVLYENLYNNYLDSSEWTRIFKFLGRGPQWEPLNYLTVQSAFSMAQTSSKSLNETLANYDAVMKTLRGSEYEYLLEELGERL